MFQHLIIFYVGYCASRHRLNGTGCPGDYMLLVAIEPVMQHNPLSRWTDMMRIVYYISCIPHIKEEHTLWNFSIVLPFSPKNRDFHAETWYNRNWKKYFVIHGNFSQAYFVASNDCCRKRCQWGLHDTTDRMNPALFYFKGDR